MQTMIIAILASLVGLGLVGTVATRYAKRPRVALRALVGGLLSANGLAILACIGIALVSLARRHRRRCSYRWHYGKTRTLGANPDFCGAGRGYRYLWLDHLFHDFDALAREACDDGHG